MSAPKSFGASGSSSSRILFPEVPSNTINSQPFTPSTSSSTTISPVNRSTSSSSSSSSSESAVSDVITPLPSEMQAYFQQQPPMTPRRLDQSPLRSPPTSNTPFFDSPSLSPKVFSRKISGAKPFMISENKAGTAPNHLIDGSSSALGLSNVAGLAPAAQLLNAHSRRESASTSVQQGTSAPGLQRRPSASKRTHGSLGHASASPRSHQRKPSSARVDIDSDEDVRTHASPNGNGKSPMIGGESFYPTVSNINLGQTNRHVPKKLSFSANNFGFGGSKQALTHGRNAPSVAKKGDKVHSGSLYGDKSAKSLPARVIDAVSGTLSTGTVKTSSLYGYVTRRTSRRTRRIAMVALLAFIVLYANMMRSSAAARALKLREQQDIGVGSYEWPTAPRQAGFINFNPQPAQPVNAKPASKQSFFQRRIASLPRKLFASSPKVEQTEDEHYQPGGPAGMQHTLNKNGLLLVNTAGKHPIHQLIDTAEKKWALKVSSQSKTLDEAIAEYKQRNRQNPPRGFDKWWDFAEKNGIILTDEYDQIARDMEPYRALEPQDMRHRARVMQDREHTFTLSIHDGTVTRHGNPKHADLRRAKDMAALMQTFAAFVPGVVNMTFVIDDNPAVMMSYHHKDRMLELARQGDYWTSSEFVPEDDSDLSNFGRACPPNSPLRRSEQYGDEMYLAQAEAKSFIHDHTKAVDICTHPEFRKLHGHTAGIGMGITPIVPLFTWAKTPLNNDILVTPLEQYDDDYKEYDPPFAEKTIDKLLWRGSTTGTEFRVGYDWEKSQRSRLHFMSLETEGTTELMWSNHGKLEMMNASKKAVNEKYLDTRYSGSPAQCDEVTCKIMEEKIDFAPTMGLEQQNEYRYLMDVDGNGWSGRFNRLLTSNGVVLKSTVFPEWYADRIQPWVHYVPIKVDYSDLYDVMAFFTGNPEDGRGSHTEMAERIGTAGREFSKKHWRRADMAAYMFRLVLEYARLLQQDMGEDVDYIDSLRF